MGGNPHRWYDPADVQRVIRQMVADYQRIDPTDRSFFARQESGFVTVDLKPYSDALGAIRARYAGTPVGASESIFAMLSPALGLNLITPPTFLKAISEGTDVSAADKETIDNQIKNHEIKVYIYNSQNSTPDISVQVAAARTQGIPVTTVTETLAPADLTFQAWQVNELRGIEAALARATGR